MSWGNPTNWKEKLGQAVLAPAAFCYELITDSRNAFYESGQLKQEKLPAFVVSVGNITVGGTGKTPVVIDLAQRFIDAGHKVAILSRGYKRKSDHDFVVVSDGSGKFASVEAAGDEPLLMAHAVSQAVVIVGSKRIETGKIAIEKFGCNLIILDDGFQHRKLARDVDIVLIDYNDNPENDACLPAGRMREGLKSLNRAHHVVITKVPEVASEARLESLRAQIEKHAPNAKLASCSFVPKSFTALGKSDNVDLKGKSVVAFCGIARPEGFFDSLQSLGLNVVATKAFPDHHWFYPEDFYAVQRLMETQLAEIAVTTAKDAVRIGTTDTKLPVYVLNLEADWLTGPPQIEPPKQPD